MAVFTAYTRRELDREPILNFRALLMQARRIENERRKQNITNIAFGSRVGQADSKDYTKAIRDIWRD